MIFRLLKLTSITLVLLLVSTWVILFFTPAPPLLSGVPYSKAVYDSRHQLLRLTLSTDAKYRLQTPLADISSYVTAATLLQEDRYFYRHIGINPISLSKAAWRTYLQGSRRMGASTITMQVVHIRYGIHSKTLSGKLWQIIRALQLEMHYSKKEILEAYLNLAPYGNNIEGIGAASLIYFGKPARDLTLPEALTLAVIPQNPSKRIPDKGQLKEIRNKLFTRWVAIHPQDKNKAALMELPLQIRSVRNAPFLAPHFVNDILARKNNSNQIITTLDDSLQKLVQQITRHYISRKSHLGVKNASVLILDTRDMSIKALMGSADFFNTAIGGQIDGTTIKRSPGSTLKPFIYGLAIDQGLIHPGTVLKDVPHSFGSYNPENFDNDFIGPVKAKDALILSRNIPAIYLAEKLTHPSLYSFLQSANIRDLKSEEYYGLALVLGGVELTMKELVSLYAVLANGGVWKPIRDIQTAENLPTKPLLSPEASFLVLDMLKQPAGNHLTVATKTGTSSGYRDAWTIGLVGPYVLAVWIGNFNNQSNQAFVGKEIASPLFMEIAHAMNGKLGPFSELYPNPQRLHLTKIEVCKASGMLPTRYCTETEKEWFIPGKSPIKTDTIFREVAINRKTGLRACQFDAATRFEIFEFWPSDLLKIFKRAGIQRRTPPSYDPTCTLGSKVGAGFSPQITSPITQVSYISKITSPQQTLVPLAAVVDADVKTLFWFLNEKYLGKSSRNQNFLWRAIPGRYVLRVVDDYGRSDARDLLVQAQ